MEFEKKDKGFVIWWIDRQFANKDTFPCKCCCSSGGKASVTRHHVTAYKDWTKLSLKRKKIIAWIEQWLSEKEVAELQKALKKQEDYKSKGE